MPTVIDSLVVTIGLDPAQFKKGQAESRTEIAKTKDEIARSGKHVEESSRKMEDSLLRVSKAVLGLMTVILSGRGLKDFIQDVNASNAALGRFSATMGVAPQAVGEMRDVVGEFGGTVDDVTGAFKAANDQVQRFQTLGAGYNQILSQAQSRTGKSIDFASAQTFLTTLAPIIRAIATHPEMGGPAYATFVGQAAGLSDKMIVAMEQTQDFAKAMAGKGPLQATRDQVEATENLQQKWAQVVQHVEKLGNDLTEITNGPLAKFYGNVVALTDRLDYAMKWAAGTGKDGSLFGDVKKTEVHGDFGLLWQHFMTWAGGLLPASKQTPSRIGPHGVRGGLTSGSLAPDGGTIKSRGMDVGPSNPLPVTVVETAGARGGFWEWLTGGASSAGAAGASEGAGAGSGGFLGKVKRFFGGGNAGIGGWWTADRIKHATDYLVKNAGLSEVGAAGLVARWSAIESPGGPTSVNPVSGASGIGQWLGSRRGGFTDDFDSQLKKTADELNGAEIRAANVLRNAKTASEAALGASMFERAEGYNPLTGADNFTGSTPVDKILGLIHPGAGSAAKLSNIANSFQASTSNSSNEMHVGTINVNAPNATDAQGIGASIMPVLARNFYAQLANGGQM